MDQYKDLKEATERCQGVVFDLDETLVNLNVDWHSLKNELSRITLEEKGEAMVYTPLDQKVSEAKEKFGTAFFQKLLDVIAEFELREERYVIHQESVSLLRSLNGKKVGIYSMNTEKCVMNFIEKYLKTRVDSCITKDTCQEPKPSEKDLRKIMKEWGMIEKDMVYIGNSENDRRSGEMAGIRTFIISF